MAEFKGSHFFQSSAKRKNTIAKSVRSFFSKSFSGTKLFITLSGFFWGRSPDLQKCGIVLPPRTIFTGKKKHERVHHDLQTVSFPYLVIVSY